MAKKNDKRSNRVQPIRLSSGFFPLDIHKSMMINDLMVTIPAYYVSNWGKEVLDKHKKGNSAWVIDVEYYSPKDQGTKRSTFSATLYLSNIKGRNKESCYRLKWKNDVAIQIAKDYPKSFVRALEFHVGDERYKELKFTEFDIGGFKEQLQIRIEWEKDLPKVTIKELFKVKEVSQVFPMVFNQLSNYLIADYLLSSESEISRRIQVSEWNKRDEIGKELKENNLYLLLSREENGIYVGETKQSLSRRYPTNTPHHTFDDWKEYCLIQLPPETSDHTRLLLERVLIAVLSKILPNKLSSSPSILSGDDILSLMNRKKS